MRELNVVEASWSMDAAGSWLKLRPELPGQAQMVAGEFDPQKRYTVTIKEFRKKRSLDANRYLWALCNKLSVKVGIPPEEVYRHYIPDVGDNSDTICISVFRTQRSSDFGRTGNRTVSGAARRLWRQKFRAARTSFATTARAPTTQSKWRGSLIWL